MTAKTQPPGNGGWVTLSPQVSLICWFLVLAVAAWPRVCWRRVFRSRRLSASSKTTFAHVTLRFTRCALNASGGLWSHATFHTYLSVLASGGIASASYRYHGNFISARTGNRQNRHAWSLA